MPLLTAAPFADCPALLMLKSHREHTAGSNRPPPAKTLVIADPQLEKLVRKWEQTPMHLRPTAVPPLLKYLKTKTLPLLLRTKEQALVRELIACLEREFALWSESYF